MNGTTSPGAGTRVELAAALALGALLASGCSFDFEAPFAGGAGGGGTTSAVGPASSGAGGSASTGEGAGGPGGGRPAVEQCDNGVDDDDDGEVDCADASCRTAGYTCVAPVPDGWEGPVALARGPGAAPPDCGGSFPDEIVDGGIGELTAPPAACGPCSCSAPDGADCTASLTWYLDESCVVPDDTNTVTDDDCVDIPDSAFALGIIAGAPQVEGGACDPSPVAVDRPDAVFDVSVKLCGADVGAGCSGDDVCAPEAGSPFDAGLCVFRHGPGSCADAGPYTLAIAMHADVDDDRGCSDCSCGPPEGIECSGTTSVYEQNDNCNGMEVEIEHDGLCHAIDGMSSYEADLDTRGGACDASGGVAFGAASPIDPVVVCCLPAAG